MWPFFLGATYSAAVCAFLAGWFLRDQKRFYEEQLDVLGKCNQRLRRRVDELANRTVTERDAADWWKQ